MSPRGIALTAGMAASLVLALVPPATEDPAPQALDAIAYSAAAYSAAPRLIVPAFLGDIDNPQDRGQIDLSTGVYYQRPVTARGGTVVLSGSPDGTGELDVATMLTVETTTWSRSWDFSLNCRSAGPETWRRPPIKITLPQSPDTFYTLTIQLSSPCAIRALQGKAAETFKVFGTDNIYLVQ